MPFDDLMQDEYLLDILAPEIIAEDSDDFYRQLVRSPAFKSLTKAGKRAALRQYYEEIVGQQPDW